VKIITTGAGTPKKYMPKLKEAGVIVIPVVPSAKLAKKMEDLGADAVVAEGTEAGGHIGEVATMPLITAVTKAVSIPVVAAGGISDGRGLAAAFSLGADGVQMGTVYLASKECPIPDSFKEKVIESIETSTVVTGRRNGAPVRTIRNAMTTHYIELENQDVPREELEKLTMGSLAKAVVEGDVENGSLMAGQILGNITSIRSVAQIHEDILKEYRAITLPKI
jgi:enoyl-[acyl-carrier protein] reductase II